MGQLIVLRYEVQRYRNDQVTIDCCLDRAKNEFGYAEVITYTEKVMVFDAVFAEEWQVMNAEQYMRRKRLKACKVYTLVNRYRPNEENTWRDLDDKSSYEIEKITMEKLENEERLIEQIKCEKERRIKEAKQTLEDYEREQAAKGNKE